MEKKQIQLAAAVVAAIALTPTALGNHEAKADTVMVDGAAVTLVTSQQTATQTVNIFNGAGHIVRPVHTGTTITVKGTATINNQTCYYLGRNDHGESEFVQASAFGKATTTTPSGNDTTPNTNESTPNTNDTAPTPGENTETSTTDQTGILTITDQQGSYLFDKSGVGSGRKLEYGTRWKYFGTLDIGGVTYYDTGNGNYVLGETVSAVPGPLTTTPAKPVAPTVTSTAKGVVTVIGADAYIFNSTGASTGSTLSVGTHWRCFGTVTIGGVSYYDLGGGQYLSDAKGQFTENTPETEAESEAPQQNTTPQETAYGVVTVTTGNTYVFNKTGASTGNVLSVGSQWKYFATAKVGGTTYYDLGGGQYIATANANVITALPNATETPTDTQPTITPLTGTVTVKSGVAATVYDHTGAATVRVLPKQTSWKVFGTTTIAGVAYYSVGGDQFVRLDACEMAGHTQTISGQVTVTASRTFLLGQDGTTVVLNEDHTIRTLERGTSWKVFAEVTRGSQHLYDLGGGQFVDANDVQFLGAGEVEHESQPVSITGTIQVNYVDGYGVQLWHQNGEAVTDIQGKAVKLMHGTTWKVFAVLAKDGHNWYCLGGDQWIDGSYVTGI